MKKGAKKLEINTIKGGGTPAQNHGLTGGCPGTYNVVCHPPINK